LPGALAKAGESDKSEYLSLPGIFPLFEEPETNSARFQPEMVSATKQPNQLVLRRPTPRWIPLRSRRASPDSQTS
jgi:hypothetical protein